MRIETLAIGNMKHHRGSLVPPPSPSSPFHETNLHTLTLGPESNSLFLFLQAQSSRASGGLIFSLYNGT
jgi:hypothetical protein